MDNLFKDISIFQEPAEPEEFEQVLGEESVYETELPISDEPELVAQVIEEVHESIEPLEQHIACTVCDVCLELNLTTKSAIACARCEQAFCLHFASTVDAQYCVNCLSDINVTKQVITKEYVHRDEQSHVTSVYRRRAREVKIGGLDWLFAQRKIVDLADVELDLAIEYHRNILSLMISEQERRRNERMHRYAGVKVTIPTPSTTTVSGTTTTTVKKTRTVSKNKAAEQVAAILNSMKAKGTSLDDIMKMLKGGK